MKRFLALVLSIMMVFCFVGCGNTEEQDALISYINEDLVTLAELEAKFLDSYGSVSGDNYVDDETMYNEFVNVTVVLARQLNDAAVGISTNINNTEISEAHKIYMESVSNYLNAVTIMVAALENQDYELAAKANEKITQANSLGVDFKNRINELAESFGVVLE